jgi:hypothetical protein
MSTYPYQLNQEPLALLGTLADRSAAIQMSHTYRGLLVTTEISLMKLYNNRALFHGLCSQIGIKPGDQILLHSPTSNETLAGRVLEINHHQCMLSVGELVGMEHLWSERGQERVQAPEPVRVFLRSGNCGLPTFLENLSLAGAGLLAYKPAERGLELRPGQAVKLDFKLPQGGGHYSLPGRIANIDYPSSFLAMLGVVTFPSMEQARQLERYITHRKAEILDEINYSFNGFFEVHKVTNLYF